MSNIVIDQSAILRKCSRYIQLCYQIAKNQEAIDEMDENVGNLLENAHLQTRHILCELQILKVQLASNIKITEKQIGILRNGFTKILSFYQKLFISQIPCPMQEIAKRIELLTLQYEMQWLKDMRMLGLALNLFENHIKKSKNYFVALNYQYQFAAVFRNSILCKHLRPQLGKDNRLCNIRREQIMLFHRFADEQIEKQQAFFVRTKSLDNLEHSTQITRALIELGFTTENEFFDAEHYKKQDKAFTELLLELRYKEKK